MDYAQLYRLLPKVHSTWTISDTALWLNFISLPFLVPHFQNCSIDGSILANLTQEDFRDQLHIESKVILKKLMNWITVGIQQFDQFAQSLTPKHLRSSQRCIQSAQSNQINNFQKQSSLLQTKGGVKAKPIVRQGTHIERKKRTEKNELIIRQCESNDVVSNYSFIERGGSIGKQNNNDIVVMSDLSISRRHADIIYSQGNYYIKDCGSIVGTFIKVTQKKEVSNGMILQMGSYQFVVLFDVLLDITIQILDGPTNEAQHFPFIEHDKISIGRKDSNEINFPQDQHMSGIHARLYKVEGKWYVEDMATTNGTWIRLSRSEVMSALFLLEDQVVFKLGSNSIYECQRNQGSRKTFKEKEDKCIFCLKDEKNAMFMPCKHSIACVECVKLLNIDKCNCCQSGVQEVIKIFTA